MTGYAYFGSALVPMFRWKYTLPVQRSACPAAIGIECVVPAIVAPVIHTDQQIDPAMAVPVNGLPRKTEAKPIKYWVPNLPARTKLKDLVALAKQRWIIEQNYEELEQELGLGHHEGRGWRGFHHHATLCIAAYGFLVAERSRFSPLSTRGQSRTIC